MIYLSYVKAISLAFFARRAAAVVRVCHGRDTCLTTVAVRTSRGRHTTGRSIERLEK